MWLRRVREAPFGYRLALALVLGGALGNVIDRLFYGLVWGYAPLGFGNVVDFLHLDVWSGTLPVVGYVSLFPIGNVADVSILVGIGLLLIKQKAFQQHLEARHGAPAEPPPVSAA